MMAVFCFCLFSPFFIYYLSSNMARLLIIFFLYVPLLCATLLCYSFSNLHKKVVVTFFILFALSLFIFLQRNLMRFPLLLNDLHFSETIVLAQFYAENGKLIFPTSHSYFPQTPLIIYTLSRICGFSPTFASYTIFLYYITFITTLGLYIFKETLSSSTLISLSLTFFTISSNLLLSIDIGYRDLGLLVLILVMFFLFRRNRGERRNSIIMLLTVFGITLGAPTANLLLIIFFLLLSILWKHRTVIIYALIPLSYTIYTGYAYMVSLKRYASFAWEGFIEFLNEIISGNIHERVLPWKRTVIPTREDMIISSISYLSLLLTALLTALILTAIWLKEKQITPIKGTKPLLHATCLSIWITLIIATITYIGASVKPEAPFSDIRTIIIIFTSTLIPIAFISKEFLTKISKNHLLPALFAILLVISSLRIVYDIYPKSINDPIYAVEDARLSLFSAHHVGLFIKKYYLEGAIIIDYKTSRNIWPHFMLKPYDKQLLSSESLLWPSLRFPTKRIIVFDMNGLKYPSLYISPDAYKQAYNLSLTKNRIYNNGAVIIVLG